MKAWITAGMKPKSKRRMLIKTDTPHSPLARKTANGGIRMAKTTSKKVSSALRAMVNQWAMGCGQKTSWSDLIHKKGWWYFSRIHFFSKMTHEIEDTSKIHQSSAAMPVSAISISLAVTSISSFKGVLDGVQYWFYILFHLITALSLSISWNLHVMSDMVCLFRFFSCMYNSLNVRWNPFQSTFQGTADFLNSVLAPRLKSCRWVGFASVGKITTFRLDCAFELEDLHLMVQILDKIDL